MFSGKMKTSKKRIRFPRGQPITRPLCATSQASPFAQWPTRARYLSTMYILSESWGVAKQQRDRCPSTCVVHIIAVGKVYRSFTRHTELGGTRKQTGANPNHAEAMSLIYFGTCIWPQSCACTTQSWRIMTSPFSFLLHVPCT